MIEHLESYLGKIIYAWEGYTENKLTVLLFRDHPQKGISSYVTLGLSNYDLNISPNKIIGQELIVSVYQNFETEEIASFLLSFAEHLIKTGKALLRGEVVGPGKEIIKNTRLKGIYSSIPVFFEDTFHVLYQDSKNIVFVWLILLFDDELSFVKLNGWNAFEDILEHKTLDFWDIYRSSFI